ncbi:MAG: lytic transglycosylase domain-containing protein, partial [Bacteroidota bacterium]|nr:lytic transglycosylase domain-containing protein [Bacteroidota bacterium]
MNNIYRLFFITAFVIFSSVASAFTVPKDSLGTEANTSEFEATLDSVLNLWYIEKSLNNTANKFSDIISTEKIPDFPDSVYIERLSKIPSIIPLSFNQEVKSYINVYTKKKRTSVEVMLGLMDYYFPMIEEIFDSYNLPLELRFLPVIESALNPRAVSRVGATGLWQFMYGTGRNYGLTVNSLVDERRDPINATRAAAKYVKDLYNIFHDWVLVIAAYNCGPGNVNKAIRRSGGKKNYWSIYYNLPRETRGYVPAFIAATYTMNYYKEHGLVPKIIDMPQATDTIMITDNLHLKQVSGVLNLPIEELRNLNPQYRYDIVPGKTLPCTLTLPFQYTSKFIDMQDSIFAYKDSLFFNPALKLMSPAHSYTHYRPRYTAEAKNSEREQERERI